MAIEHGSLWLIARHHHVAAARYQYNLGPHRRSVSLPSILLDGIQELAAASTVTQQSPTPEGGWGGARGWGGGG